MQTFSQDALSQFIGTEHWYRHPLNRNMLFTDGVKFVTDTAEAYWLLDLIALAQLETAALRDQPFQVWRLTVEGSAATLTCEDGDGGGLWRRAISFTDFPAPGVTLWLTDNVILLPSEY